MGRAVVDRAVVGSTSNVDRAVVDKAVVKNTPSEARPERRTVQEDSVIMPYTCRRGEQCEDECGNNNSANDAAAKECGRPMRPLDDVYEAADEVNNTNDAADEAMLL